MHYFCGVKRKNTTMKSTTKVHLFMFLKNSFRVFMIFLSASSAFGQSGNKLKPNNQPQIHSNVNREYDDKGNVIRYDSTYTWSWSNMDTTGTMLADSMLSGFSPLGDKNFMNPFSTFGNDSPFLEQFSNPFLNDSLSDIGKQIQRMMKQQEEFSRQFMQPNPLIPAPQDKKQPEKSVKKDTQPKQTGVDL
jgi:hypothetical protein